jgi:hypothetical protein
MKKLFTVLLAGMMIVSLAACTGTNQEEASVPSPQSNVTESNVTESKVTESDVTESDPPESTASRDDETVKQPTPITKEINQVMTDPELGFTITVKQAIIDIPFDDPNIWYNGYRTGICVEVELTNDSEYATSLYDHNLKLLVDGKSVSTNSARVGSFQAYADENNLAALGSNGIKSGESASGWLFYYFDTGAGNNELVLRYSRRETKIVVIGGTDFTLPAMDVDVPIS